MSTSQRLRVFMIIAALAVLAAAGPEGFDAVKDRARGRTVDWFMYGGFPAANAYVNGYVAPRVQQLYGIELRQVPVTDLGEVVGKLLVEKRAGKNEGGSVDLLWINGENFKSARDHGLLYGPFARDLPNSRYVDWDRPSVSRDFGEPVDGFESPWGSAQIVIVYEQARTPDPPRTLPALLAWARAHPGRFTYPAPPDFTGSAFIRHVFYMVGGGAAPWQGEYSEEDLQAAADRCYRTLRDLAPYLWREGRTYPESPLKLSQLFADGQVDFAMSYHPAEAGKMIRDGLYPPTARTLVFEEGTLANTHFVAVAWNAADRDAALVVADFLLSPEAQLKKAVPDVWGDLPAIDPARLEPAWQKRFAEQPRAAATLPDAVLRAHQLPEPPSEILVRLEKGWTREVLKKR